MLIKTIEEVRNVLPVNISLDFVLFKPDLERAEEDEVIPLLGETLYAEMQAKYDANTLNPLETRLLGYCHRIVCNLGYVYFLPKVQVQTSSQGVHIVSTETKKTAFQWQIKELADSHRNAAYDGVEKAMNLLDNAILDFPSWQNSNSYTQIKGALIENLKQLETFLSVFASYRLFRDLIPQIKKWDEELRKSIAPTLVSGLSAQGLQSAKRYVAYMSVAEVRGIAIDNGGLYLRKASSNDMQGKESAPLAEVVAVQDKLRKDAQKELAIITKELFPTGDNIFPNDNTTKFFAI